MDIKTKKLDLIQWIANIHDEGIMNRLEQIKNEYQDGMDDLPLKVKKELQKSIEEADSRDFIAHEDQIEKYRRILK